jgi:two-component system chemotaxis response regulator CheB
MIYRFARIGLRGASCATDPTQYIARYFKPVRAAPSRSPKNGEAIEPGRIYVAPPDHHLTLEPGFIRVTWGPRENRHRPAVDPPFQTAARAYGPRVVSVILTETLDCGTAGLMLIKARGRVAVVQDPNEALAPDMPRSAITHIKVDYILPPRKE